MTALPIPGWEDLYSATDDGQIVSHRSGRALRPSPNPKGYLIAVLARDGKRFAYPVHRLIAETFLGPRPEGWHTCHNDGDKTNNHVSNLRYDTASANELDNVAAGRHRQARKTHCPQGHEYTEANTMRGRRGDRKCRACHYARNAAARKAVAA